MSTALKCDRCGVCFDPYSGADGVEYVSFSNPAFQTVKDLLEMKHGRSWKEAIVPDTKIDLCPGCTRAFEKFMKCEEDEHGLGGRIVWYEDEIKRLRKERDEQLDQCQELTGQLRATIAELKGQQAQQDDDEEMDDIPWDYTSILFDTKSDAQTVLTRLRELIRTYGNASIFDLYDIIDRPIEYVASKYGWRNLDEAVVVPDTKRNTWMIAFPKVQYLPDDNPPIYKAY